VVLDNVSALLKSLFLKNKFLSVAKNLDVSYFILVMKSNQSHNPEQAGQEDLTDVTRVTKLPIL